MTNTIKKSYLFGNFLLLTMVLAFAIGLILFQSHRNNQQLLHEQTRTSSYLLTHQILSLNHTDSAFISEMLGKTLSGQSNISKVLIYSDDGNFMGGYLSDKNQIIDPSLLHIESPEKAGSQFQIVHAMATPENTKRYVYIQYNQDSIFNSLKFLFFLMAILFLIIEITIIFIFQRGFLSPLGRMVSNITSIGSGKISGLKTLKGDHPFENIYQRIKVTDQELYSSKKELDTINRDAFLQNRELSETENRLRLILDNSIDGVFTLNNSGEIDFINIACEELLQFPSDELEGQSLNSILPRETQMGQNKLINYLSEENTSSSGYREELICMKKDESEFTALITLLKVPIESTYIFIGSIQDISPYKAKENNLQHATLMAEEQSRSKSESIANMAHEFKSPMDKILNVGNELDSEILSDEQKKLVQILIESSQSLREVLNNLLDLSKIESGKMKIEKSKFDLVSLIEDTTHGFTPSLKQKNLDLFLIVQPDIPQSILGDPNRLKHAFTNLVSNAVKYTNKGYIKIQMDYFPQSKSIEISVTDTGIGMNQNTLENLFEHKNSGDGLSAQGSSQIGMSVTKELINLMNGKLLVTSEPGSGSTFRVVLKDVESEGLANDSKSLQNTRILVGPTNSNIFSEIKNHVGFQGGEVIHASNMEDCLHYLNNSNEDNPFHAIMLDEQREGLTIAKEIRNQNLSFGLEVIVFSWNRWKASEKNEEQPFDDWIPKPLKISRLIQKLAGSCRLPFGNDTREESGDELFSFNILVVEDNKMNQKVLTHMLKELDCKVDIAENGLEALGKRKSNKYDIIFMDIHMPELDGYATTAKIRSEESIDTHQIIVAMTANTTEDTREKCLEIGMDDYLTKPMSKATLVACLEKWKKKDSTINESPLSSSLSPN